MSKTHTHDYHAALACASRNAQRTVVEETLKIAKGGASKASHRFQLADPGCIYVEVGSTADSIRGFASLIEELAPKDYKAAKHGTPASNPPAPVIVPAGRGPTGAYLPAVLGPAPPAVPAVPPRRMPIIPIFLTPIHDCETRISAASTPQGHRSSLQIFEQHIIEPMFLREFECELEELRRLHPQKRVVVHFYGAMNDLSAQDLAILKDGDIVFVSCLTTEGESGYLPKKKQEAIWQNVQSGGNWKNIWQDTSDDILLTPLNPWGNVRRFVNVYTPLRQGYVKHRRSRLVQVAVGQGTIAGPVGQNFDYIRETDQDQGYCCTAKWNIADENDSPIITIFHGVIADDSPLFRTALENNGGCPINPEIRATAANMVARINFDLPWKDIRSDMLKTVGHVQNAHQALVVDISEVHDAVALAMEDYVKRLEDTTSRLGALTCSIRKARVEAKIHQGEGWFTRHASKNAKAGDAPASAAFLEIRRWLTSGAASGQ
jgi:hypothetical protein